MARTYPAHVVTVPSPVFQILRVFQNVFAVAILGLLAYIASVITAAGVGGASSVLNGGVGIGIFSVSI
jgi:hypothetical protein